MTIPPTNTATAHPTDTSTNPAIGHHARRPGRPALSVAIICKDAARTIERTLAAVTGWADEVVAVDSGSTDATLPLLERFGARVIPTTWKGFVATRQESIDACASDWVLCLDADETPDEALRTSIDGFLASEHASTAAGATLNRKIWYRDKPLNHAWQPERRLRLIHRDRASSGGIDPHAELVANKPHAVIGRLDGTLRHDGFVTFAEQLGKDMGYARTMATNLHARGVRGTTLRVVTSPTGAFLKQMVVKQAWRDGWAGWCAAASVSVATALKHIMLLELTHAQHDSTAAVADPHDHPQDNDHPLHDDHPLPGEDR